MNRVTHFEIPCDDLERATKFYTAVFGWNIKKWDAPGGYTYYLVETGKDEPGTMWPGINGGLVKRTKPAGESGIFVMDVANIDEAMEKVKANGGKDDTPKVEIPGMGTLAYMIDTEGNRFGLMQGAAQVNEPQV